MGNTLNTITVAIGEVLSSLEQVLESSSKAKALINALGWELPPGVEDIGLASIDLTAFLEKLRIVIESSEEEWESEILMASRIADLAEALSRIVGEINHLARELPSQLNEYGDYVSRTNIDKELSKRMSDLLIAGYLSKKSNPLFSILQLLNIVEFRHFEADPDNYQIEHVRAIVHYKHINSLLSDPSEHLKETYGWGTTEFSSLDLLTRIGEVLRALGATVRMQPMDPRAEKALVGDPAYDTTNNPAPQMFIQLYEDLGEIAGLMLGLTVFGARPTLEGASDGGIGFLPIVRGHVEGEIPLYAFDDTVFEFSADADLLKRMALILRPNLPSQVQKAANLSELADGRFALGIRHGKAGEPKTLVSFPGGSHLTMEQFTLIGGLDKASEEVMGSFMELGLWGGQFTLFMSEADGFLSKIISLEQIQIPFDFRVGWNSSKGIYFLGSAGLSVMIPLHRNLGPIFLQLLHLTLNINEESFDVEVSTSGDLTLGPLAITVGHLGMDVKVSFTEGNLGFFGLSPSFKPPTAIGLSIDSQGIKGGGFLSIDPPNYFGVLELSFQDEIDLTAFGLITTKLPDGQDGFSLVISILAEFQPIQLGLGFALTGVGGLIGINRQMNEEALRETVKSHSLDHILFPAAPIKDAVKIIDSIKKILPPKEGFHVFGPMAQIIWGGSVTLVEFQVGIFIEIGGPVRIALIGQASSRLPNKKAPVVVLNMDVLGYIDFGKETVAIDSSLFDSHIQGIKIDGQMALRSSWGDDADFAMSVGGFFPRYTPPPGFPTLKRLAVTLGDGNPKISLSAYMAITSNTLQFGALLELWAKKRGFTIAGGMGFDALFIFNPFSFEVAIEAWVDVRRGGFVLMAVSLGLTLTGPNPFRAKGYAKIRICWFLKFKVRFDVTFGTKQQQIQATVSPLTVLRGELEDPRNIRFELPHWASATLMFAEGADQRLDRSGSWVFSQNAVPLNFPMARFGGTTPPAGEQQLSIAAALPGETDAIPSEPTTARFAPEQFHDWSVEDRLAAPAFEEFESGLSLGGSFKSGPPSAHQRISVEFETVLKESDDYLSSLNESNPKKVPQRYLGLASATIKARSQATARSRPMYTPRRNSRDTQHPNFVSVAGAGR